jgi:hypothetical protein
MPHNPTLDRLRSLKSLPQLAAYLRDELDWPIESDDTEDITFDYNPAELGLDGKAAVRIKEIKQLRPLAGNQPWGIFFVNFEKKSLPVVVMRQILRALVFKKRASANKADRQAWQPHDLLFISAYGEDTDRAITLAHFVEQATTGLAELRVLGWDDDDTPLHMDYVVNVMKTQLRWDAQLVKDPDAWRARWSKAFLLRHRHVVRTSEELAEQLAELARRIRARIRTILRMEDGFGEMRKLQRAFQTCLIHDLDDEGFADMFAQTVTYGLFSVSVRRTFPGEGTAVSKDDVPNLIFTSPFLKDMLGVFLGLKSRKGKIDFDDLGISDITDFLTSPDTHMEVVLADFNNKTRGEDPVIHFYEHFLEAYNKKLKVDRGVFYTPQPVVSYIVRSVHELLQTEFGLADGLADTTTWGEMIKKHPGLKLPPKTDEHNEKDTISPEEPFVQILDPATGTATFLVEVIDVIHKHLEAKWKKGGLAAMPSILNPPSSIRAFADYWNAYVPKALLPRLHAFELMMAPYAIAHMKVGLKLSETGYRFGSEERARIYLTNALEPKVKQLPNFGFEALAHEAAAVNEIKWYKRFTVVVGNPPYSNFGGLNRIPSILSLLDEYKRGLGERKINLDDDFIKFIRFSHHLIQTTGIGSLGFITNNTYLDGVTHRRMRESLGETFDQIRILDLHGSMMKGDISPDGSDDENVFDIKQGVAVSIFTRSATPSPNSISYAELWGNRESKYSTLVDSSSKRTSWSALPGSAPHFFFVPKSFGGNEEYEASLSITDVFGEYVSGIQTGRDSFVSSGSQKEFDERLETLKNESVSDARIGELFELPDFSGFDLRGCRRALRDKKTGKECIKQWLYRPFDIRPILFDDTVIKRMRGAVMKSLIKPNLALITVRQLAKGGFSHVLVTKHMGDGNTISLNTREYNYYFPLRLYTDATQGTLAFHPTLNLTEKFVRLLSATLGVKVADQKHDGSLTPEDVIYYAYAVFHSPGYRSRYAEFLKIDFPRLPLTGNLELFGALARLGGELVALHLLESSKLEKPITEFIGGRSPVMEKVSWSKNTVWLDKDKTIGFKGVREDVWNFHIGGYQVCEKWLKDRKGRTLTADDRTHYQKIVVALSETIRLMKEIDEVITTHGGWPLK